MNCSSGKVARTCAHKQAVVDAPHAVCMCVICGGMAQAKGENHKLQITRF